MEKKFLACLLALCMLLTMAPIAAADANESPFTDVTAEDWFYDAVLYVQSEGICQGTSETTFSPNEVTTRGMIVTILWRMAGSPIAEGTQFDDVATNQYYADAILWAATNEIVTGYGDGAFGPNDAITREQLATILYRYAAYAGEDVTGEGDLSAFSDAGSVSAYAAEALVWANAQGLITGMDDGKLAPQGGATRAQVAMILYRMADAEPAPEETPGAEETVTYTVTFDWNYSNKGTYETAEVAEGEAVAVPEIPTRDGYSFLGWYTTADGTTEYAFSAAVTEDITLYAHWSKDAEPPYTEGVIHLHKYSEYIESTDGGVTHTRTCSCGRVLVDDCTYGEAVSNEDGTHSQTCADCGYVVVTECAYGEWVSNEDGTHSKTCADCGYVLTEDCDYADWADNEDGTHTGTCACSNTSTVDCEYTYENDGKGSHTKTCDDCGAEITELCTLTTTDYVTYSCECGYTVTASSEMESPIAAANGTAYETVEEALQYVEENGVITLLADFEPTEPISVSKSVVINGNGNTITSNNARAIQVEASNVTITLNGVTIDVKGAEPAPTTPGGLANVRGINVVPNMENVTINVINTTIDTTGDRDNYGINVCGGTKNITVNVENSTIKAFQDINIYGEDCVVNVTDSTLEAHDNGATHYARENIRSFYDDGARNTTINLYGENKLVDGTPEVVSEGDNNVYRAIVNPAKAAPAVINYGTLTIDDGVYVNDNIEEQKAAVIRNEGTLTINGGTIGSETNRGAAIENHGGTVVINGGTFNTMDRGHSSNGYAYVFINYDGQITINDATSKGNPNGMFYAYAGTITVNGGDFAVGDGAKNTWYMAYAAEGSVIALNGGTYAWEKPAWNTIEPVVGDVEMPWDVWCQLYGVTEIVEGFGETADGNYIISTVAGLAKFAETVNEGTTYAGKTVTLLNDIDLENQAWTPIGPNADAANKFTGTFDGGNNTISNLSVDTTAEAKYQATGFFGALGGTLQNLTIDGATIKGLSAGAATDNGIAVVAGSIYPSGTIKNVTVKNATVTGNRYVGGIVGYLTGSVIDCTVSGIEITATPDNLTGAYDNGDKVGGVIGYINASSNMAVSGNTVEDATIVAYRDAGGIVGAGNNCDIVVNNQVNGLALTIDQTTNSYGPKDANAAAIVGRVLSGTVASSNTATNATVMIPPAQVATVDDLKAVIAAAKSGVTTTIQLAAGTYTLGDTQLDINGGKDIVIEPQEGAEVVLDGRFHVTAKLTLKNLTMSNENAPTSSTSKISQVAIGLFGEGEVVCEGVTFEVKKATAITSWWSTGEQTNVVVKDCIFNCYGNRPLQIEANATIEGCTFNDPYRYCAQLTAADAVINFKNNTIGQATTSGKPTYGLQLTSDYGNSNLVINGGGNKIVDKGADDALYVWEPGTGTSNGYVDIDTIELNADDGELLALVGDKAYVTDTEAGGIPVATAEELTEVVAADATAVIEKGTTITLAATTNLVAEVQAGAAVINNGTLVIENGAVLKNDANLDFGSHVIVNTGDLTINGGTIGSDKNSGNAVKNEGGTVVINGGTFASADRDLYPDVWAYVFNCVGGTMTINNATVDCRANGMFSATNDGVLTVKDGNYTLKGAANNYYMCYAPSGKIVLEKGTYTYYGSDNCIWPVASGSVANVTISEDCELIGEYWD